jgi:cellulose biosynthesis protein BcsQ
VYVCVAGVVVSDILKKSKLDRLFDLLERHWILAFLCILGLLGGVWIAQDAIKDLLQPSRAFFELMAVVFGPPITAAGFYLGYRAKRDMVSIHDASQKSLSDQAAEVARLDERLKVSADQLNNAKIELEVRDAALAQESVRVKKRDEDLRRIANGGQNAWSIPARQFPEYKDWRSSSSRVKIIAVANQKGSSGKTTVATNLAAYLSHEKGQRVLLVDLDYQGALSSTMLMAAQLPFAEGSISALFENNYDLNAFSNVIVDLTPGLPRMSLVPADYGFASSEKLKLLDWLIEPELGVDARYRLARLLLNPVLRRTFDTIIIDTPPRLELGLINALVACEYLLIPTRLDSYSLEVARFFSMTTVNLVRKMELELKLLGIVGTMTRQQNLSHMEQYVWQQFGDMSQSVWGKDRRCSDTIPMRAKIAAADGELAYFSSSEAFKPMCDEVWGRLSHHK